MTVGSAARLLLSHVSRDYGDGKGVDDVTLSITAGETVGLVGENGSGKSTLFRCIMGLEPISGVVRIDGKTPAEWQTLSGVASALLDGASLHNGLKVRTCLKIGSRLSGRKDAQADYELISRLGLEKVMDQRFGSLSLGWKQRVFLAGCLSGQPRLLLLDEPFNGLDPFIVSWLKDYLLRLADMGSAVLIASHHLAIVDDVCQRVFFMEEGSGRELLMKGDQTAATDRPVLIRGLSVDDATAVLNAPDVSIMAGEGETVLVTGMSIRDIGTAISASGLPLWELRYVDGRIEHLLSKARGE